MLESHSEKQKKTRSELLTQCLQHTQKRAKRLGISGVPGVGKSTFIEAIGELIVSNDKTLAVLAVDPSSLESKGSILGDKTRMEKLSNHPNVFIRPSPSGSALGGVTRSTYETILLFEAAGFDYILIETVGVGQAEYIVRNMVDFFLLLTLPVAGDDLQGIKRGIMEVADLVAINKSEGELIPKANITQKQLEESLHYFRKPYSFWNPSVLQIAALSQVGIKELLAKIEDFFSKSTANGYLTENRKQQALLWFEENLNHEFLKRLSSQPKFVELKKQTTQNILGQHISAFQGVDEILKGVKVSL